MAENNRSTPLRPQHFFWQTLRGLMRDGGVAIATEFAYQPAGSAAQSFQFRTILHTDGSILYQIPPPDLFPDPAWPRLLQVQAQRHQAEMRRLTGQLTWLGWLGGRFLVLSGALGGGAGLWLSGFEADAASALYSLFEQLALFTAASGGGAAGLWLARFALMRWIWRKLDF